MEIKIGCIGLNHTSHNHVLLTMKTSQCNYHVLSLSSLLYEAVIKFIVV